MNLAAPEYGPAVGYAAKYPGQSYSVPLLEGDAGTEQTIAAIREQVDQGLRDPFIRQTAGWIVARVRSYNDLGEVRALYDWVRRNIRFVKDPVGKETISSARWILSHRFGDCDEINAILLPALLGVVGYRTRLVTIAGNPNAPEQFTHVYAEVFVRGRWIPVDAARPGTSFGSAPSRYFRKRVWSLSDGRFEDLRGLSGYATANPIYIPAEAGSLGGFWESFTKALPGLTKSATDVISTLRAPRTSLVPGASFQFPAAVAPAPAGIDTNTLLIGALLIGGAIWLSRKRSR